MKILILLISVALISCSKKEGSDTFKESSVVTNEDRALLSEEMENSTKKGESVVTEEDRALMQQGQDTTTEKRPSIVTEEDRALLGTAQDYFEPLKPYNDPKENVALVHLGERLYFEDALSKSGKVSCNSCHQLDNFGVDGEVTSPGHDGTRGERNSPSVYNSSLHFKQFWDGRADQVEDQALGPLLNPIEHGLKNEKEAVAILTKEGYLEAFKKAFPKEKDPIQFKNIGIAIGAFERTLVTPSKFDDYLAGDVTVLNEKEKKGLKTFIEVGCIACHAGVGVGGDSFQKLGAINDYDTDDKGRKGVTGEEDDDQHFKVPSLRNVAKTGPYYHDGSVESLDKAIELMGYHQLDIKLSPQEVDDIRAFLETLTAKDEHLYKKSPENR